MSVPVRLAMAGLGWAAQSIWLPRLRAHPAFAVTAAVDPDAGARAELAKSEPGLTVLADLDDLDPSEVDLAVVAVPNHLHCTVAGGLLRRGVSVFLEKPVCLTTGEARLLASAERSRGAMLLAGSAARYRADVRALYGLLGELGDIRHVELAWVRARGVPDGRGWFTRQQLAGGGALVDLGWHLFDTLGPILGPVDYCQVAGTTSADFVRDGSHRASWRQDPDAIAPADGDVEDTARCFLVADNGISVALRASWASHEPRDSTLIRVEGSAGSATLRTTFGFSPNREKQATLMRVHDGRSIPVWIPDEPIGIEYRRQLDEIPALLSDPANQGRAVDEAERIVSVIERIYTLARMVPAVRPTADAPAH